MKRLYSFLSVLAFSSISYYAAAQNELVVGDVKVGDLITLSNGSQWYVGTNEITNGSFDADPAKNDNKILGWTIGNYAQMTTSTFAWMKEGGYDGGPYIQASKHTGSNGDGSICQRWTLEPGERYYFSFYLSKNSANNQYIPVVTLTSEESTGGGQNEKLSEGAKQLIGKNGEDVGEILGFGNFLDENGDGVGEWCQTACSFESLEYTYLQFNARWLKENKIQACFDGFFLAKLYNPEEMTPSQVAYLGLYSDVLKLSEAAGFEDYSSIVDELNTYASEGAISNGTSFSNLSEDSPIEDLQEAISLIEDKLKVAQASLAKFTEFDNLLVIADELVNSPVTYPGLKDFADKVSNYSTYQAEGYFSPDDDILASDFIASAVEDLKKAIFEYRTSQVATEKNPADYTFYVENPNFDAQGPWYIGTSGGDQRLNTLADEEGVALTCWNAWRNSANFTDNTIQQDIKGLPNGYYSVTAKMCTQSNCITDQHLFVASSAETAVSPVMTIAAWDPYQWEPLTTGKVLVVDGNLKIGATSTGAADMPDGYTDYRAGWYCVTNFVLNYLGEASEEAYAAAVSKKIEDAKAQADTMHLAADKAAYLDSISKVKTVDDLVALNAAAKIASASEAEYAGVMGGTYKTLQDTIAAAPEAMISKLSKVVVDMTTNYINSAEATYTETGKYTEVLRKYLNDFAPVFDAAAEALEAVGENGKAAINSTVDGIVAKYLALGTLPAIADIDAAISAIKNAIHVAGNADVTIADGADMTCFISNPTIEGVSDVKAQVEGWTTELANSGNNNVTNAGQQVYGDGHYLDSWNGNAGVLNVNTFQTLSVPNGTYTLSAIARTTGDGFYLYAIADDEAPVLSEVKVVPTNVTKYIDSALKSEAGTDSIDVRNDTYGEVWIEAAEKVSAAFNGAVAGEAYSMYNVVIESNDGSEECPATVDEETWSIFCANNGAGRGWSKVSLTVEVKNHKLVVGVATGDAFEGANAFTGTWLSADNFKLVLDKAGDNDGWTPTTGVSSVESDATIATVYSVSGAKVSGLQKGINIVVMSDGSVVKRLVK